MFIYTKQPRSKRRKASKARLEREAAHKRELNSIQLRFGADKPTTKVRPTTEHFPQVPRANTYPSRPPEFKPESTARRSIMDRLHLESEEVREAILRKSKSIAPAYNKGAVQYIATEEDAKHIGKK